MFDDRGARRCDRLVDPTIKSALIAARPLSPRQTHRQGGLWHMAFADVRTHTLASAKPSVKTTHATCGHRACKAFTATSAALKSSLAGVAVVTRPRAPGPAWSGRSMRPVNGSRHRAGSGVDEAADAQASPAPTGIAQAASCLAPSKAPIERPRAFLSWPTTPRSGTVACHPVASTLPGRSIPDGEPCSPTGAAFPFASRRRTAMCASQATRAPRPVGVLLGGSGRARALVPPPPRLAALLRPAAA